MQWIVMYLAPLRFQLQSRQAAIELHQRQQAPAEQKCRICEAKRSWFLQNYAPKHCWADMEPRKAGLVKGTRSGFSAALPGLEAITSPCHQAVSFLQRLLGLASLIEAGFGDICFELLIAGASATGHLRSWLRAQAV